MYQFAKSFFSECDIKYVFLTANSLYLCSCLYDIGDCFVICVIIVDKFLLYIPHELTVVTLCKGSTSSKVLFKMCG